MFDKASILFLYVETPLHAGSGTSLGIVDLPIQRERSTDYPMVQASGIKGCLRDEVTGHVGWCHDPSCALAPHDEWDRKVKIVFGPDTQAASDHAGAIAVGDARILLFPVRSLSGVFAWTTSRHVLARFYRDAATAGLDPDWTPEGPAGQADALVAHDCHLVTRDRLVLEEFAFGAVRDQGSSVERIAKWLVENALPEGTEYQYWREQLPSRLVILPDDAFRDFVRFSTEVTSRIRLDDETKTVVERALWTEEHLPSDALLYCTLFASRPRVKDAPQGLRDASSIMSFIKSCVEGRRLQLGGDSTVGRGLVKVRMPSVPRSR